MAGLAVLRDSLVYREQAAQWGCWAASIGPDAVGTRLILVTGAFLVRSTSVEADDVLGVHTSGPVGNDRAYRAHVLLSAWWHRPCHP
jgi:hypothetical protein